MDGEVKVKEGPGAVNVSVHVVRSSGSCRGMLTRGRSSRVDVCGLRLQ